PPDLSASQRAAYRGLDALRAVEMLYAIVERDLVIPFVTDVADKTTEIGALVALAEITARHHDAQATLLIGKTALGRGFTFDVFAFPNIGIPKFTQIGPDIDR